MTGKTISILGCGWLGFPLAQQLISDGWSVKGSTTTESKLKKLDAGGIDPYLITCDPEVTCSSGDCRSFWEADILFLNIPPGRRKPDVEERYPKQIKSVISYIQEGGIEWVIFAGSTSVYANSEALVTEQDASPKKNIKSSGRALIHAEEMLHSAHHFVTTVLRFGGLYGYDRHPANYLAGKKNIKNGSAPINLIHQDDCIKIIQKILDNDVRGEVFNCVSDGHPPRKEFYKAAARKLGVEPPEFDDSSGQNRTKIVSNKKLKKELDYSFMYPNPLDL